MAYNSFINKQVGIQSPTFRFQKDRNNGAVLAGDGLGEFQFYGFDGTNYLLTSNIKSVASGTIAANRIGSNIEFYTHPDSVTASTQRMVIENTGQVQINDPSSNVASLFVVNNQSTPNLNLRTANSTATNAPHIHFTRSRAGTADVLANDELGRYEFFGFQGGIAREAAEISAVAQSVNGTNAVSGYLSFSTVPTTYAAMAERLRISGDGTVTINNPVSGVALNIVGGGQTVIGDVNLNITGTANTNINSTSNSGTVTIGNTSSGAVTIDCGTAGISVGTTANAHTTTIGSTNTTSSLVLRSGTGNIVANTGLTVDSTGRMTNSAQPCFSAVQTANVTNVTGDATVYTVICGTELEDRGSNYNNATGIFTAPVTGLYNFTFALLYTDLTAAGTAVLRLTTTARTIIFGNTGGNNVAGGSNNFPMNFNYIVPMTAGDTAKAEAQVSNLTKTVDIYGNTSDPRTIFAGFLIA